MSSVSLDLWWQTWRTKQSGDTSSLHVQDKMEFVKKDFQNCWRHTLNRDNFDSNIYFEDPISKYTNYIGILMSPEIHVKVYIIHLSHAIGLCRVQG